MQDEFRLEEYKMLRSKALDITRRIEDLEKNVVIACSAIFVFSVSTFKPENRFQAVIVLFLPLFVSLAAFIRYKGLAIYMKEVNDYTTSIEKALGGADGGWLTYYYSEQRPYTDYHYRQYRLTIWWSVILFNFVAALILAIPLIFRVG